MRLAMIRLNKEIEDKKKFNMLLQIHDELIFEIKTSNINEIKKLIREIMISVESSDHHKFTVPLLIDLNSGENWGMLH